MSVSMNLVVCRCEEVTLAQVEEARADGACTSQELKMATRAGMGFCQGRVCRSLLEKLADPHDDSVLESSSKLTVHQPVRPVPLGQLTERDLT